MPRYTLASTEFQMDDINTVGVDNDEVLAPSFKRAAGLSWPMTKLHPKPQLFQG